MLRKGFKWLFRLALLPLIVLVGGFMLPQKLHIPVKGATTADWNPESFWYYPWGRSVVHKGIDIFATKGTPVIAPTYGLVLFAGTNGIGGNSVVMLGPKWRFHYFAHLDRIDVHRFSWVSQNEAMGAVGNSGNAQGKPAHLHYTIGTIIPYPWRRDNSPMGSRKMFFLDPNEELRNDL